MNKSLSTDGKSLFGSLFLCQSNLLFVSSLDFLVLLNEVELNMAVGGQVWGDSTVSSVGSSSSVNSSLSGNMADDASLNIKTLMLSVGFQVSKEAHDVSDRLLWESTIVVLVLLGHSLSSWSTGESSEWDDSSVIEDSLHVFDGFKDVKTSACSSGLISVFKMNSLIIRSALSSYNKNKIRT